MTKEEVLKIINKTMSSPGIIIEAINDIIFVYKNCYTKKELYLVVRNDSVTIDGVVHEL